MQPFRPDISQYSANKNRKLHRLLRLLEEHGEGLVLEQMSQQVGVDVRTIKRYLAEIRRLGYPLVSDQDAANRRARYFLKAESDDPERFVPALRGIQSELFAGGNPKHSRTLEEIIAYLERKGESRSGREAGPAEVYYVDHGPFAEADPPAATLRILERSIQSTETVRVTYEGYRKPGETFDFEPYCLSLRVGTLYLIGRQPGVPGPFKSLSVRRIKRCTTTRTRFQRQPFDPREYYKYCFGQWARQPDEKPEKVVLRLEAAWVSRYLAESRFNPPGRVVQSNEETRFEVQLVIKPDFVNWVLSLLPDIVPVQPAGLVREVKRRLGEAVERAGTG